MKKVIVCFAVLIVTLLIIISVSLSENNKNINQINQYNKAYTEYLGKIIYGTDVITIINKAINENEKNEVQKDEKGFFIDNNKNSIKIELKLLYEEEVVTYQMETLTKVGIEGFIKNFNLIQFKGTEVEYHETTKKIKKIVFEQIG